MENTQHINERLDFIEFRQELLFENTELSRLLFEYKITKNQYNEIMDLMDRYRTEIGQGKEVNNARFEDEIYAIVPQHDGNYHFCEYLTRSFMNEDRWEEVFKTLYGNLPKYQGLNLKD